MSIVSISLVLLSAMITVRFLRFVLETGREENVPPPHLGRVPGRVDHLRGRILFVSSRDDDLVLDCVTVAAHPAFCALPPGTPFTLAVDPKGPPWLLGAVATMVSRWAACRDTRTRRRRCRSACAASRDRCGACSAWSRRTSTASRCSTRCRP